MSFSLPCNFFWRKRLLFLLLMHFSDVLLLQLFKNDKAKAHVKKDVNSSFKVVTNKRHTLLKGMSDISSSCSKLLSSFQGGLRRCSYCIGQTDSKYY